VVILASPNAEVMARRLLDHFARPFNLARDEVAVGLSVGVAFAPRDGVTMDEVMMKADAALYDSKSAGRGRFSVYRNPGEKPGRSNAPHH
jgi:GGDEF domain-containing protein